MGSIFPHCRPVQESVKSAVERMTGLVVVELMLMSGVALLQSQRRKSTGLDNAESYLGLILRRSAGEPI